MSDSVKTLIVTALPAEARPLVDHLGLHLDSNAPIPLFKGEDMLLVVSGIGKVKSALALGYLAALTEKARPALVLNIGVSGANASMGAKVGDLFLINKIVDASTDREFYPDILFDAGIEEAALVTHDMAVCGLPCFARPTQGGTMTNFDDALVDMEGSGFFEAASKFYPPHKLVILKIVSDHLKPGDLTKEVVSDLVRARLASVTTIISKALRVLSMDVDPVGPLEREWIEQVAVDLRLSQAQRNKLKDWVSMFRSRGGKLLPDFTSRFKEQVETKQEGKRRLEEIRKELFFE